MRKLQFFGMMIWNAAVLLWSLKDLIEGRYIGGKLDPGPETDENPNKSRKYTGRCLKEQVPPVFLYYRKFGLCFFTGGNEVGIMER